jgi:hypothetical protein
VETVAEHECEAWIFCAEGKKMEMEYLIRVEARNKEKIMNGEMKRRVGAEETIRDKTRRKDLNLLGVYCNHRIQNIRPLREVFTSSPVRQQQQTNHCN